MHFLTDFAEDMATSVGLPRIVHLAATVAGASVLLALMTFCTYCAIAGRVAIATDDFILSFVRKQQRLICKSLPAVVAEIWDRIAAVRANGLTRQEP